MKRLIPYISILKSELINWKENMNKDFKAIKGATLKLNATKFFDYSETTKIFLEENKVRVKKSTTLKKGVETITYELLFTDAVTKKNYLYKVKQIIPTDQQNWSSSMDLSGLINKENEADK
ncbi:hypothetical protein [Flammeovirga kamogawensis]|uniref:Uncharacterized protein n=1 Tax=Flammeovirga kamogawensis TaxID=373891 RepID=A0ABX8H3U1_9BACT|nr:hypothetical protein [Flammeovirga kamogawensis]MBB6460483.1 hypothetical protein [Flammeovirga kamogawensis]QWG10289.1 hypothetical protein KM029_21640 [Flammeovirga kamogawensis]TRX64737.1 hypothetical protein EO216_19560 [Flammeovirga kamogawensis]